MMKTWLPDTERRVFIWFVILLFPALFYNLGVQPLTADEPTRAIVAAEMEYSGNYLVSTINGEYYYKKPPLFNWIVSGFFQCFGKTEFALRLAAVIPLLLFSLHLFLYFRKYIGNNIALLGVMMFITNARMISYDSYLGHIDILYSWLTFWTFILIFEELKKENYYKLFLLTYFISALTFMLKGLPTVLFQGITLVVWFWISGKFKKLFSLAHLSGLLVFFVCVGGFFYAYSRENSLMGWVDQLWDQSKQRTVIDKAWYENFIHLFKFPLDHVGHLAPWVLLALPLFYKHVRKSIAAQPVLYYFVIVFLANIPVYWLSPGYYPRYLLMLYPIVFIVIAYAWIKHSDFLPKYSITLQKLFMYLGSLLCFVPMLIIWWSPTQQQHMVLLVVAMLLMIALVYAMCKAPRLFPFQLAVFILCLRIVFNDVGFPHRAEFGEVGKYKAAADHVGHYTLGKPLFALTAVNHESTFYIERVRGEILYRVPEIREKGYYIIYKPEFNDSIGITHFHFPIAWEQRMLTLIEVK
jgi:4-amino-4-deoxy-L-arabinose transferase-like glycosyltransferase